MTHHPINKLSVESPVSVQNLIVFPLTQAENSGPSYISLSEAIANHGLRVTEVSDGGSVPNLRVENPSDHCVLLLDGEELRGAKQNRIVNTTLLLAARSQTIINVSCTEMGRWQYNSPTFSHSGTVMSTKARRKKTRSVSHSLEAAKEFHSNQGEVWNEVEELHQKVGSQSETSAMADAYEKMRQDLDAAIEKMPVVENQCGLIVMIDNKPAGLDLVSRTDVYADLHSQLIQSYAMEASAIRCEQMNLSKMPQDKSESIPDVLIAKAFIEKCAAIKGESYRSVALGVDWRFKKEPIVGSGLEVDDTWIHMAYFVDEQESDGENTDRGRMARMSQRSRYRRGDDIVY